MLKKFVLSLVLSLVLSGVVRAEATSKIKYLMNEPVSLFDRGMDKLQEALRAFSAGIESRTGTLPSTLASYHWDMNRINITQSGQNSSSGKDGAKQECIEAIKLIKLSLLVDHDREIDLIEGSMLYQYFKHSFYSKSNEPKGIADELKRITNIAVSIRYGKNKEIKCKAPLVGKEVSFVEANP